MKKLLYLFTIIIVIQQSLSAMREPILSGKKPEMSAYQKLPHNVKERIIEYHQLQDNPQRVILSYKAYLELPKSTAIFELYKKFLLTTLSDDDFKSLNQYIFHEIKKDQIPQDVYLLIDLLKQIKRLDTNAQDNQGFTSLIGASLKGHIDIAKSFIDSGANLDAKTKDGYTALMWATIRNHKPIVKLLIDSGADVNEKNNNGWTALLIAGLKGHSDVAKLLTDAGATR